MGNRIFITRVFFIAFTRECEATFEDGQPLMRYSIRRRVRLICPTSKILTIRHYEATLINEEVVNDNNTGDHRTGPVKQNQ